MSRVGVVPLEEDEQIAFVQWCRLNHIRGSRWLQPKCQNMDGYLVNEFGDLVSFRKSTPYLMKRHIYNTGYQYYSIQAGSKALKIKVHRIVAKTFLTDVDGKDLVNHKDGDKTNNYFENLEWCTNSENQIHAFRVLGSRHAGKPKRKVLCVETGEIFGSVSDAAKNKNTFRSAIRKVINGSQRTAGGFTWQNA